MIVTFGRDDGSVTLEFERAVNGEKYPGAPKPSTGAVASRVAYRTVPGIDPFREHSSVEK